MSANLKTTDHKQHGAILSPAAEADVLVVGSGMAGVMAALAAAQKGKTVRIVSRGKGSLAIAGGTVDVLGYVGEHLVTGDPVASFHKLPATHPYSLVGEKQAREALSFFIKTSKDYGYPLDFHGGGNSLVPTVLGTFRPSGLNPEECSVQSLGEASRLVVCDVAGVKDCQAELTCSGLQKHGFLQGKAIHVLHLENPYGVTHRNLSPLDIARFIDTNEGMLWLLSSLKDFSRGEKVDQNANLLKNAALLLPPILGIKRTIEVRAAIAETFGAKVFEMASLPPGVGGLRIAQALTDALHASGVNLSENAFIAGARVSGTRCEALFCEGEGGVREIRAESFIIATGGFLGGGLIAEPGKAVEKIFGLPLQAPSAVMDWSVKDVFSPQPYSAVGVTVDASLRPVDVAGNVLLENVRFAGRSLAGYDFITEKSGNGVALVTGYHAGACAGATDSLPLS